MYVVHGTKRGTWHKRVRYSECKNSRIPPPGERATRESSAPDNRAGGGGENGARASGVRETGGLATLVSAQARGSITYGYRKAVYIDQYYR